MNLKNWGLAAGALLASLGSGVGLAQACDIGVECIAHACDREDCIEGQPAKACDPGYDCIARACEREDCIEGQPASPSSAAPAEACTPEIDCIARACTDGVDCIARACTDGVNCIEGQPASPSSATPAEACDPEINCIGSVDRACDLTTGLGCGRQQPARACMGGPGCDAPRSP